jgi:Uncharacterized protein conserved in bacteria
MTFVSFFNYKTMKIEPMLIFDGDCSEALKFYTDVFNGKQVNVQTYEDNKIHLAKEHINITPRWKDKIMHASFAIPSGVEVFYGQYRLEDVEFHQGMLIPLLLSLQMRVRWSRVCNALSKDGTIVVSIHKAFWHAMYAEIKDKFKKHWKLNCPIVSVD